MNEVKNGLKAARARRGLSQQQLAEAAGVTRQTVGGIEGGLYAPTAAVALRFARALGCRVEDLFWLDDDLPTLTGVSVAAAEDAAKASGLPCPVTLARVGGRWMAYPLIGDRAFRAEMVPADGFAEIADDNRATVRLLDDGDGASRTVALAGCAPVLSLWARSAERWRPGLRVDWTHANSSAALAQLVRGEVHAAGVHLYDAASGEHNVPAVRTAFAAQTGVSVTLVCLGVWEEGFVVAPGNPKGIGGAADLARPGICLINREAGAGARFLLDDALRAAGVSTVSVAGYADPPVRTHQAVAQIVQRGGADAGVTSASVAQLFGLDFVPLREVRYDLALRTESLNEGPVRELLETLDHRWVREQLRRRGGYDTARTGETVRIV